MSPHEAIERALGAGLMAGVALTLALTLITDRRLWGLMLYLAACSAMCATTLLYGLAKEGWIP